MRRTLAAAAALLGGVAVAVPARGQVVGVEATGRVTVSPTDGVAVHLSLDAAAAGSPTSSS